MKNNYQMMCCGKKKNKVFHEPNINHKKKHL